MTSQQGLAEVNGTRLYYEVAGSGTTLVLMHGYAMDTRMWDCQFKDFAQRYRVIRYDLRGFGKSTVPREGQSYSNVEDLRALLDFLSVGRAHLLGLSHGGRIAINLTVEYPEMVSSLIAVDCGLGGMSSDAALSRFWDVVNTKAREAGVEEAKKIFVAYPELPTLQPAMRDPETAQPLLQMISDYSGWHWLHDDPGQEPHPPAIERLESISAPTLCIVGEFDIPRYHAASDLLSQRIPGAKKFVIKGAGHMCNMENPEQFNELVLGFLARL